MHAASHMEADAEPESNAKALSQEATEDIGVIIEETEAYKVGSHLVAVILKDAVQKLACCMHREC